MVAQHHQVGQLTLHLFQLGGCQLAHLAARRAAAVADAQDRRQFRQREAQRQRAPYQPDAGLRFRRVLTIAGRGAARVASTPMRS